MTTFPLFERLKKIVLPTAVLAVAGSVASAQSLPGSSSIFSGVELSYSGGLQLDSMSMGRGGLWYIPGPDVTDLAHDDVSFLSAYIATTATFGSGTEITLSYGQILDGDGETYNQRGEFSWNTGDAEGHVIGVALAAPLGNGFSAEFGLRHFSTQSMTAVQVDDNLGPCPDATFDNCYYSRDFITADAGVNYTANLANDLFYNLSGGVRFTQGYSQIQVFDNDGTDESQANVGPLLSVDPVLSATIGYDLGAYDVTATAMLVGSELSYGIGFETSVGDRTANVGTMAMSAGAFTEFNSFSSRRQIAWESQGLVDNERRGALETEIVSAGVFGEVSTDTTDMRLSFGSVLDGTATVWNGDSNSGNPANSRALELGDASGFHIGAALSTDLVNYGSGMIRGDIEIDYMNLEFASVTGINRMNNWNYLSGRVETLTTAIGASYHTDFGNGFTGYAGLDYLASAGHSVFSQTTDFSTNQQSNRSPALDSSYRVRLGANYEIGGIDANFEVSGNDTAGVSVSLSGAWTF